MAEQFVNYSVEENVATIVINNPPVNALSTPVMSELDAAIEKIKQDLTLKQAENVAALKGIQRASYTMPDAHQGFSV